MLGDGEHQVDRFAFLPPDGAATAPAVTTATDDSQATTPST
jgi:hypothetical protein